MKKILLGITGSIAAYKAPELVRLLIKRGYSVTPVCSIHALKFVSKLTLAYISGNKCYTDDDFFNEDGVHLKLIKEHEQLIIAPASANTIAKIANGICDNLISALCLCNTKQTLIFPAMHHEMINDKQTQTNISQLTTAKVIGPITGDLGGGDHGNGRMIEPSDIVDYIEFNEYPKLDIANKKVIVSFGPTHEYIDTVKKITNLSTGQFGITLSKMASFFDVNLSIVSSIKCNVFNCNQIISVSSAETFKKALDEQISDHDYLIMPAAISDYTVEQSTVKMKRGKQIELKLTPTDDILQYIATKFSNKFIVGFCLDEAEGLETSAIAKCKQKKCNYVIANTVSNVGSSTRSFKIVNQKQVLSTHENVNVVEKAYQVLRLLERTT